MKITSLNYAKINDNSTLEIHTDNGIFINGEVHSSLDGRVFEISGEDLMKIYCLLKDKEITRLNNVREHGNLSIISNYIFVGENVESKHLMEQYVKLLNEVERINNTRHWWERKIKITD